MRLEKIVLNGFKSFADKTEFTFDSPITGIVGPNGCGKSNIVDAVKWVLGEQSVKSLRSEQMADVIFSGSSSRKAVGAAEVSLSLSNPDGTGRRQLPIEADEVQITRRIYKSGESEYRINNKICRLKDIRELLMDTGAGVKAYSIIEQGQVGQLLSASRTDRRAIFEEAAGISKYRAHKKEALRKLEYTEQNLLRLADILSEVQKQLRSIKFQAGKARNYLQYCGRLKELQMNYSLAEYAKNRTQNAEKKGGLERLEDQLAGVVAEVTKNDTLISELGQRIIETENELNHTGNCLVAVQSKIEQNLQRIEFLRTRTAELRQRKEDAEKRIEKLQEQKNLFEGDLRQYRVDLASGEKMLEGKKQEAEQLQKAIQEIDAECASLDADLEDEKSGIIDIVRRTAQLHNEVQSIGVYRNSLSSQKDRLSGRAETSQVELEKLLTEKAQHIARMGDIEKVLGELQQSLDSKHKETEEINRLIAAESKRLAQSKEARSALSSELSVLADMEVRREGLNNAVKNILQSRPKFDYVEGILAEAIAADVEYANAVEASLEGRTDALVINSTSKLMADKETIEKLEGRVNFIRMDKIEPFVDKKDLSKFQHIKGRLAEFVGGESKYAPLVWKLLGKTIVVDSIDAAIELAERIGEDYKFVTLKGEFLSADGAIKLGPLGKTTGLISRKSRLRQLQETIAQTTAEITEIEGQLEKNNRTNEHLTKLCKELRTAIYEANTEKMQVSSKLTVYEQNIKRLSEEQPLIAGEIELLEAQIAQSVQKEYDSKQKLQELEAVNSQRTRRIEELEAKYAERKAEQQRQTSRFADLRVALGQITEQIKALKQTIAGLQSQMQENQIATETAQAEIQSCSEQSQETQRDILNCEAAVSELFVEKEKNQSASSGLQEKIEKLLEEQKQTEQLIRQRRAEQSGIESAIGELKIELSQLEVKGQDLVERVRDELQIDLVKAYENYRESQVNWDKVREEIAELRGKIERLGNVNVDAIAEQDDLDKRNEFLSSQVEDLNKSKAQLQQLISHLNKKSRERFKETFEEIRVNFQQVFRKLFGGGKADIVLEDTEDILEAGIEIIARMPGKESMSVSLLSGGEKALTAIALLFAVFKIKPSPFCFLDEVDATLDEANNERFNMLLREFQKDSQFVVITHSKRTMSIAEVLFGITMQTRGVSKKISVRFDHVDEETAAVA
ncbi:MAG: chromosome segregation protein SMC [Sedimentisphaerales bacterium]